MKDDSMPCDMKWILFKIIKLGGCRLATMKETNHNMLGIQGKAQS